MKHYSEDELTLYYYGEDAAARDVERISTMCRMRDALSRDRRHARDDWRARRPRTW